MKRMYRSANIIVPVTDSFKKFLIHHENIAAAKIIVAKNGIERIFTTIIFRKIKQNCNLRCNNRSAIKMHHMVNLFAEATKSAI